MGSVVGVTKLGRLYDCLCDSFLDALKGEPLLDKEGNLVLIEGKPVYLAPKAATLREIREFLKDNGIDEPPIEGSKVQSVAKALTHSDDDEDPFAAVKQITGDSNGNAV